MNKSQTAATEDRAGPDDGPALSIALDKVCWIIVKTREFDVKSAPSDADPGSNGSDDSMVSVLEDRSDDPVEEELRTFISGLSEDEQIDLVALAWLGRDDGDLTEWASIRNEAARAHADHRAHTARYLLGEPLISDFIEEGLSLFGLACDSAALDDL